MKRFKNILVSTDTRLERDSLVEEAADIARQNGAKLTIVDVVPELPWLVRAAVSDSDELREAMVKEKERRLKAIAESLTQEGLGVATRVLEGKTSVAIIKEVLRHGHDLVIRIAKGRSSQRDGFFGATAFRLLRKCPCPVWIVSPAASTRFEHVLGCVNPDPNDPIDEELNDQVIELARSVSQYHGGRCSLVHVWSLWNEPMLKDHLSEAEFALVKDRARQEVAKNYEATLKRHRLSLESDGVELLEGEPIHEIPRFAKERQVDLVVLGTVGRSGIQGILMGNTAEQILDRIECSVLAVKPSHFVSPIKLDASPGSA